MQCKAKSKRSQEQCRRRAVTGRDVCMMHGGKSPAAVAHPSFQSGRYSKYLPERLLARYDEAQSDSELIALREEVALTDARLADLLKQVDTGESGALWAKLQGAFDQYRKFKDRSDKILEAHTAFNEMDALITAGLADRYAWAEIGGLIEQRRKLVESETKRLKDLQQMITAEKAMTLIASLAGIVKKHVTDRDTLAAISADLIQLTGANSRQ